MSAGTSISDQAPRVQRSAWVISFDTTRFGTNPAADWGHGANEVAVPFEPPALNASPVDTPRRLGQTGLTLPGLVSVCVCEPLVYVR